MIRIEHLNKSFSGTQILKDISIEYLPGRCNMVIGASGSGKTVLLKTLIGLYSPDSGNIWYGDENLAAMSYCASVSGCCFRQVLSLISPRFLKT